MSTCHNQHPDGGSIRLEDERQIKDFFSEQSEVIIAALLGLESDVEGGKSNQEAGQILREVAAYIAATKVLLTQGSAKPVIIVPPEFMQRMQRAARPGQASKPLYVDPDGKKVYVRQRGEKTWQVRVKGYQPPSIQFATRHWILYGDDTERGRPIYYISESRPSLEMRTQIEQQHNNGRPLHLDVADITFRTCNKQEREVFIAYMQVYLAQLRQKLPTIHAPLKQKPQPFWKRLFCKST